MVVDEHPAILLERELVFAATFVPQKANALLALSRNGTGIHGAAGGGALVAAVGPGWALAGDAWQSSSSRYP